MSIDGPACGTCHRTLFDPRPCPWLDCPMGLQDNKQFHRQSSISSPPLLACRHGTFGRCTSCEGDLSIEQHGDPSRQSHAASFAEAATNVLVGFGIASVANYFILPLFGFLVSLSDSFFIGLLFTFISLARSYALRRLFEILRISGILP